jgi:hypothetical protein
MTQRFAAGTTFTCMENALGRPRWPKGGICHHAWAWVVLPNFWYTVHGQSTLKNEHIPSLGREHDSLAIGLQILHKALAKMKMPTPIDVTFFGRHCVGIWPHIETNITQGQDTLDPRDVRFITVCWERCRTLAFQTPALLNVAKF